MEPPILGKRVELQISTTLKCNLSCSYCVLADGDVLGSHGKPIYTLDQLDKFTRTHLSDKEIYFTFFGGEPLMNRPFIYDVMDRYPDVDYQIITNGTLLHKMDESYLSRFTNFLISIDGTEQITNKYRGKNVFSNIMKNVDQIKHKINGTLTARVTWCDPDLPFEAFDKLLETFDWVHFQFAQQKGVYFPDQVEAKMRVIDKLVERFYSYPGVYPVVPLMGIARNLAVPGAAASQCSGEAQCRSSTNAVNIGPDGKIFACTDMTWISDMQHGSVIDNTLTRSPLQQHPDMPCNKCEAQEWCRGNCMKNLHLAYVMKKESYRNEVVDPVCSLVKYLGKKMAEHDPVKWFHNLSEADQTLVKFAPIYDFVEIIP
jgi:radical SAM protein with 4Fe4S-binding SPASM domain